jgi:hypothetical protein
VFACGTVTAGSTAKNAPPLSAGGDSNAVIPATNKGPTTAVKLLRRRSPTTSMVKLLRRCSPPTSTIGSSLLHQHLLLSTSAVSSLPLPRLSRAWANDGGQIIVPPLPCEVHDWVIPTPPAPPPVDIRGPILAAPPLIACVGQRWRSDHRAAAPPRRPDRVIPPSPVPPPVNVCSPFLAAPPLVTCVLRACALLATPSSHGRSNPVVSAVAVAFVATALWGGNIVARPGQEGKGRGAVKELPFWSLAFTISVLRVARSVLGLPVALARGHGWRGLVIATIKFSGACIAPALAWAALGALVALRYNGLFCPVGEISS